jgi:heme exporter protein D
MGLSYIAWQIEALTQQNKALRAEVERLTAEQRAREQIHFDFMHGDLPEILQLPMAAYAKFEHEPFCNRYKIYGRTLTDGPNVQIAMYVDKTVSTKPEMLRAVFRELFREIDNFEAKQEGGAVC